MLVEVVAEGYESPNSADWNEERLSFLPASVSLMTGLTGMAGFWLPPCETGVCQGLLLDLSCPVDRGECDVVNGEPPGAGLALGKDIGIAGLSLDMAASCLLLSFDILTRSLIECCI